MNPIRLDAVSRLFAERRLSRRSAVATSLAAGTIAVIGHSASAQDATPVSTPEAVSAPTMDKPPAQLFVQSFQSGSIATNAEGAHTVTLEHGLGQTIVFTDRPSREVFTAPTPAFLDGLGFDLDNPPNAAIVMEVAEGNTDIAVVELFNPTYEEATHTATYDVSVLANWEIELELGFQEEPTDLSNLATTFGATHLFIDGCSGSYPCGWTDCDGNGHHAGYLSDVPATFWYDRMGCVPGGTADTHTLSEVEDYWASKCNQAFPACEGRCRLNYEIRYPERGVGC